MLCISITVALLLRIFASAAAPSSMPHSVKLPHHQHQQLRSMQTIVNSTYRDLGLPQSTGLLARYVSCCAHGIVAANPWDGDSSGIRRHCALALNCRSLRLAPCCPNFFHPITVRWYIFHLLRWTRPTDDAESGLGGGWRPQLPNNPRLKTGSGDGFHSCMMCVL